ncbi:unnamed protein product [Effrenium voratum]|nr:unnamed protein product [Effrenium voratum]
MVFGQKPLAPARHDCLVLFTSTIVQPTRGVCAGRIQGSSPLWAEGLRLRLPPFHTLFRAKQQILEKADGFLPKVESASRREVQFFAGNSMLPEHMLAAMLPEEVSMVFSVLPRCMPASRSSWGTEPGTSDFDIFDVGELSDASI